MSGAGTGDTGDIGPELGTTLAEAVELDQADAEERMARLEQEIGDLRSAVIEALERAGATGGPPAGLPTAELGEEHLEQLVDELVGPPFVALAERAVQRAEVVAYVASELARDYDRLTTALSVLVDAEAYENSGSLVSALEPLVGLDVVAEVLDGLRLLRPHTDARTDDSGLGRVRDFARSYVDAVGERAAAGSRDGAIVGDAAGITARGLA